MIRANAASLSKLLPSVALMLAIVSLPFFILSFSFTCFIFFSSQPRFFFFFFNDTATTEIYTLSLHDALPISNGSPLSSMASRSRSLPAGTNPSRSSRTTADHGPLLRAPRRQLPVRRQGARRSGQIRRAHV